MNQDARFLFQIIKTESHGPSFRPDTEGSCYIPCPTDCVISEWLPWQQCPNKATGPQPGYQKRARLVVVHPGHGGRQCAEDALSQMKPCPFTEYFRWKVSEWSQCFVEVFIKFLNSFLLLNSSVFITLCNY